MEFPVHLDRAHARSLQWQLTEQLKQAMLDGRLSAGARIPSTRSMAQTLRVSRNVVLAAYDELFAEGYIIGRHGSGTYVVDDLPAPSRVGSTIPVGRPRWLRRPAPPTTFDMPVTNARIDFRVGQPSMEPLPERIWRHLWREMSADVPPDYYGPPAGYPELRAAIAGYLNRSRGIACDAEDLVVTSGASQAIDLIGRATLLPGDAVAFEEPGYPVSRCALLLNGATVVPVPVDEDGLQVDALQRLPQAPTLAFVSPSHQYPTGARMSVARRLALLDWAREHDSLIVEDDYDSEFRFDAAPLPALAGLDNDGRVVYVGTFSKMLTPAIRVGYVLAPPLLRERIIQIKRLSDFHTSWPVQRVLTRFLQTGLLETHIRRMRRHYAEKRALLAAQLEPVTDLARLRGFEAGLHAFVELAPHVSHDEVMERALAIGVGVTTIDEYFYGPTRLNGILLGYGGLNHAQIREGGRLLVGVIAQLAGERRIAAD